MVHVIICTCSVIFSPLMFCNFRNWNQRTKHASIIYCKLKITTQLCTSGVPHTPAKFALCYYQELMSTVKIRVAHKLLLLYIICTKPFTSAIIINPLHWVVIFICHCFLHSWLFEVRFLKTTTGQKAMVSINIGKWTRRDSESEHAITNYKLMNTWRDFYKSPSSPPPWPDYLVIHTCSMHIIHRNHHSAA